MAPALSASVDCDVSEMGDLVKTPARKLSTLDVRSEFDGKDVVEFLKGGAGSWDVINWGRCVRGGGGVTEGGTGERFGCDVREREGFGFFS